MTRLYTTSFLTSILFFLAGSISAQAPMNDVCSQATLLECNFSPVVGSTDNAVPETPPFDCNSDLGVWYRFLGDGSLMTISSTASADFDHGLLVLEADGGCSGTFIELDCVDNNAEGQEESLEIQTEADGVYYVYVAHWETGNDTETGDFSIQLTCESSVAVPANDDCSNATPLACGDLVDGTTNGAISESAPGDDCASDLGVWYSFLGTGQLLSVTSAASLDFDHELSVFSAGIAGNCASSLTTIACVDEAAEGGTETVDFITDIAVQYFIYVGHENTTSTLTGDFNLLLTCTTPPLPPINDECITATELTPSSQESCLVATEGTLAGATFSDEAANDCNDQTNQDVWYNFTAVSMTHQIILTDVEGEPSDLSMVIYSGACDNLTRELCADGIMSTVGGLTVGEEYFIQVQALAVNTFGTTTFDICVVTPPAPPSNDACDDAIVLTEGMRLSGTTENSTIRESLVPCMNGAQGAGCQSPNNQGETEFLEGVWFSYTAENQGSISVSSDGSRFDTELQVWQAVDGDCSNLNCIAGDDDSGLSLASFVCFDSGVTDESGPITYLIYLSGQGGATGEYEIVVLDSALPVEFSEFRGSKHDKYNQLDWTTASEENTEWHILERASETAGTWNTIEKVAAMGISNEEINYTVYDEAPLEYGLYRVRSVDFDGYESLSPMVEILRNNTGENSLEIFPNPVNSVVNIQYQAQEDQRLDLQVVNSLGQVVLTNSRQIGAGTTSFTLDASRLNAGIYFVIQETGNKRITKRFIKN